MTLQQLHKDAPAIQKQARGDRLPPRMHSMKLIRWIIALDREGRQVGFVPLSLDGKKGDRGVPRLVPHMVRASAIKPLLFADKPSYVLGVQLADPKEPSGKSTERKRTLVEHQGFKDLVRACAEETGDPDVAAVLQFLEDWNPADQGGKLPPDLAKDHLITFEVEGRTPSDNSDVQDFWARHAHPEPQEGEGIQMQCLVSGEFGPVANSSALLIKGIPNGQMAGTALVSANAPAFESYGLRHSQTSPISSRASERCSQAINALLSSERHHLRVGGLVYVFWSAQGEVPLLKFLGSNVDPTDVQSLIASYRTGTPWTQITRENEADFHCLALSASGGRVVIRSTINTTVGHVRDNLARWFERIGLVDKDGTPGKPLGLYQLAVAPFREGKDITPDVPRAITEAALENTPLPLSLMRLAVLRCVAEANVTYPRAAIIKAVLCQHLTQEEIQAMSKVNPQERSAAYHCGRLLAELESIQKEAIPGINATIVDRWFRGASSAPARVFGPLLSGAQAHLGKLRTTNEPAYRGGQSRLEEILHSINEFPPTVDLFGQAEFSLGYYHQRAAKRADITERSAAKKAAAEKAAAEKAAGKGAAKRTEDGELSLEYSSVETNSSSKEGSDGSL